MKCKPKDKLYVEILTLHRSLIIKTTTQNQTVHVKQCRLQICSHIQYTAHTYIILFKPMLIIPCLLI